MASTIEMREVFGVERCVVLVDIKDDGPAIVPISPELVAEFGEDMAITMAERCVARQFDEA